MKLRKTLTYVIIAVIVIAGVLIFTQVRKKKSQPEWKLDSISNGTIREVVTATGSLNPTVLVEVGTEVSGTIKTLYKDYNDHVRKGELLAKLDTEILMANVESAQTDLTKARISRDDARMEYKNSQALRAKDMVSEYDLQKAKNTLDQAELSYSTSQLKLQTAQKNLSNATITSPIDGVIISREVSEGQTVAASMNAPTLFTIANNLDQMEITASIDEADIGKIKVGLPVEFTVDSHAGETFTGSVQQIRLKSTSEQNVVSYNVIIDAANPEHKLLPGMTTNVSIITQSKDNVPRIPEAATRFTPTKEMWKLFGLKWEDDLISNARKSAMEKLMGNPSQEKPSEATAQNGKSKADTAKATAQNSEGGRGGGGRSGRGPGGNPGGMRGGGMPGGGAPGMMGGGSNGRSSMSMIWVLKDKTPELIAVRTGVSDGAFVELLSPLDSDVTIITGVNYKDPSQAQGQSALRGPGMGGRF